MTCFADSLKTLKQNTDGIARLEIYGDDYEPLAVIENKPGQSGSLAVYYEVAVAFGGLNAKAAQAALVLFAEHTQDARENPGKHPNIDRLFEVIEQQLHYSVKALPKT